jgi:hypothetical protein
MTTHLPDSHEHADAPLSSHAAARRDAILADLLARAPAIRRARTLRRTARHAAIGAAPLLVILTAVAITRARINPSHTAPSPRGPLAAAPHAHAPADTHPKATHPASTHAAHTAPTGTPTRPTVRVVSTAGRSFEHMVAPSRTRPELIDDQTLLTLLNREGKNEGIIHLQGRTLLTSDLANAPALPLPPSLSPPQSSL